MLKRHMSLLPGEREGGRKEQRKKKSFHAPIHIKFTNAVVHYHYYINQCLSHSFLANIHNIFTSCKGFYFNHTDKKKYDTVTNKAW